MTDQMALDVGRQVAPRPSEIENNAVTSCVGRVSVCAVQKPIVDSNGITNTDAESQLVCVIAHDDVSRLNVSSAVDSGFGRLACKGELLR